MALSQLRCLDDNNVNPRTHESKPEFLYSEDQRLALEALLRDGRQEFLKYLEARGLRGFLSDLELESLAGAVEPYDTDSEVFPENAEDDEPPLSLHYWPDLSDTSVPRMDLGWPDSEAYRGVTRVTVYTQPPLDGQAHIKEVVRKTIAQAQKVIAVVMDVFTDVDIFRDLLDAGFKRKVSVYILLERSTLPHFLSMCQRASMHAGHLKHLRVRCTDGAEFHTRSCTKVRGQMGHRFMFIDGDKAVSGSYSFTWMSSRLDKNLITMVTGQAVHAFDQLFRCLYGTSSSVDLRQITMEPEPEPGPLPQLSTVALPSAAVARKLYSPKYALVVEGNPSSSSSPTPAADNNSPKESPNPENSKNPDVTETKRRRQRGANKEAIEESPPLHPGLVDLEKACLIAYLPTWPEPDPPSDVIGYINIRDTSKPAPVHLQRSEMFETSQAVRFSTPISMPKETLPEVAMPQQITGNHVEKHEVQPRQDIIKAGESGDNAQPTQPSDIQSKEEPPGQKLPAPEQRSEHVKDASKALNTENKLQSSTSTNQDAGHNTTPHLAEHTPSQSSSKASAPNNQGPSRTKNNPKPEPLPGSNTTQEAETSLNSQSAAVSRTQKSNSVQSSHLCAPADTNSVTSNDQKAPESSVVERAESLANTGPLEAHSEAHVTNVVKTVTEKAEEVDPKSLTSDCKITPKTQTDHVATAQTDTEAPEKTPTGCEAAEVPNEKSDNIQTNNARARAHEPHGTPYYAGNPLETVDLKDSTHIPVPATTNSHIAKDSADDSIHIQRGNPRDTSGAHRTDSEPNTAQHNTHIITSQESQPSPKARATSHTPERPLRLHFSDTHMPDQRSPAPERELPSPTLKHTPTPDGVPPHMPTPASQTQTADPCSHTTGLRTPTPNDSDGDVSPREDSNPSTTSEEYYECSNSPLLDGVFDHVGYCNHGPTEDHDNFTHAATPNESSGTADSATSTSSSETAVCGPGSSSSSSTSSSSSSSLPENKANVEENGREEDENGRKLSGAERKGSEEAKRTTESLKIDSAEIAENNKETQPQAPERKRAKNKSEAESLVNVGTALGKSTNKETDLKHSSTSGLKPEKAAGPGKEKVADKVADKVAQQSSNVERRGRPQAPREKEGHKLLHTSPKLSRGQRQRGSGSPSPSRPPRTPRPWPATQPQGQRPWRSHQLNHPENKVLHYSFPVSDNTSSLHRSVYRGAPPFAAGVIGSAAGQKQTEVSSSQQSLISRQPLVAQDSARARQSQNQHLHPEARPSLLHKHSNMQSKFHPHSQSQMASAQEAPRQEERRSPFTVTFSRLYNLKGLKDKLSQCPAQSRADSTTSPVQGQKSTR